MFPLWLYWEAPSWVHQHTHMWRTRRKQSVCHTVCSSPVQDAYSEVASLFAEFFRDLDIVPSDIIAGLVLLRQRQRSKRSSILDQVSLSIIKKKKSYLFACVAKSWNENSFSIVLSLPKANNDILAFLSGMPVTRNTRYLDLKNSVSFLMCDLFTQVTVVLLSHKF